MKKIYPNSKESIANLTPTSEKPITQQQYEDLVNRTNCAEAAAEGANENTDSLRNSLASGLTTGVVNATNANIQALNADSAVIANATINNVSSQRVVSDVCVETPLVKATDITTSCISGTNADLCNIQSNCIEAENINVDNLSVNCELNFESINTSCINSQCAEITNVDADTITSNTITSTCQTTDNLVVVCSANVNELTADSSDITTQKTNELKVKYITHKFDPQSIVNPLEEYWIVVPKFTNGEYFIESRNDGDAKLWSIEIDNSQSNIRFKWSNNTVLYLKDVDIVSDTDGIQFIQIHFETNLENHTIYSQSISLDNVDSPSIYSTKQYEGGKHFDITALAGTYMPNAIFAGAFHAESLEFDESIIDKISIAEAVCTPTSKDSIGGVVSWTSGNNNDYLTNVTDENNNTYMQWVSPATCVEQNNQKLISSDAVYNYNGTATDCDGCVAYPISHLNEDTCVHGSIEVECNIVVCCSLQSATFNDSNTTNVIECGLTNVNCDGCVVNWSRKTCDRMDELAVLNSDATLVDGKPVVYNETTNSLETTDALEIDELNVSEIHADKAYIKELDTVKEETISSTGDYVVLRANNPAAMSSTDHSGILIHNYDGNGSDAAIVVDSDGIVRIGDGVPTSTTYSTLYFDKTTEKYYTDIEDPTTEVEPEGALTSWASKDDTTDYIKYTNAVFSVIAYSSLEPVLTRSESASMTDNSILAWNASCNCAVTIPAPTCAEQILTTCLDANDDLQYQWSDKAPGVYCFASMACYNAYTGNIPEGSEVVIADCINYLKGDNQ